MTRKALEKLTEKQKHYCETLSLLIDRFSNKGNGEDATRYCAKLKGYLEALGDLEIISAGEKRCLYLWYVGK